jgi:hypothetical protein
MSDPGRDGDDNGVMILRAAVLLATMLVAGLLGTGVAAAAPAPSAVPAAASAAGVPCRAGVRACVRLSTNQAWLLDGKKVVAGPVPISHGRAGFRTPPGTFRVSFKDRDHISSLFDDAPMPYSVFFNGDIAFHQGSVRVASHGCIHLPMTAARTFFANLRPGDRVQVVR